MEKEILQFLIQVPILAIFLWWMNKQNARWDLNNEQWRAYLTERNGKLDKSLEKLGVAMDKQSNAIDRFHERLDNLK